MNLHLHKMGEFNFKELKEDAKQNKLFWFSIFLMIFSIFLYCLKIPNREIYVSGSLIFLVMVVVIKLFLARYLLKKGKELDSQIISASGKESLTDVFSSIVVFFGIISVIVGEFFEIDWLLKGDKVASIIIAIFIIRIGLQIIYDSIKLMQGKSVNKEVREEFKNNILKVAGVINVDRLVMIAYGPYYQALVDIRVDGNITVKEGHEIAENVTKKLYSNEKINHVVVHVNPEV